MFLYTDENAKVVKDKLSRSDVYIRSIITSQPIRSLKPRGEDVLVMDYGLGNLYSIVKAVESLGFGVRVISSGDEMVGSSTAILPGVGAFPDGIAGLKERGFHTALEKYISGNGRLLGICLGAQMLLSTGNEFEQMKGLNVVDGSIDLLAGEDMKVPNVGWNPLQVCEQPKNFNCQIFRGLDENSQVYFNHSYFFNLRGSSTGIPLATCNYSRFKFCAAFCNTSGNVCGVQFHPEKSGPIGMRILQNFLIG